MRRIIKVLVLESAGLFFILLLQCLLTKGTFLWLVTFLIYLGYTFSFSLVSNIQQISGRAVNPMSRGPRDASSILILLVERATSLRLVSLASEASAAFASIGSPTSSQPIIIMIT